jgi:hypothetical protein
MDVAGQAVDEHGHRLIRFPAGANNVYNPLHGEDATGHRDPFLDRFKVGESQAVVASEHLDGGASGRPAGRVPVHPAQAVVAELHHFGVPRADVHHQHIRFLHQGPGAHGQGHQFVLRFGRPRAGGVPGGQLKAEAFQAD